MEQGPSIENPDTREMLKLGDINIKTVSPFEIVPDPEATSPYIRDLKWMFHSYRIPVEDFKTKYSIRDVSSETVEDSSMETQYNNLVRSAGHLEDKSYSGEHDNEPFVTVKEYYENPTPQYPQGRFIIFTNEHMLFQGELPYGKIPFAKFDDLFVPDRFWGMSTVEQLIPLQTEYNRTRSQILENRNLMSNPKWVAPRDAVQDVDSITAEPGEIIYYNAIQGVAPPTPISMPSPPSYVFAQEDRIIQDMMSVSGITDVNLRSTPPSGVESGRAMALLAEKDESRMTATIQSWENMLSFVGGCCLELAKYNYTSERHIRVVGADNISRMIYMVGSDLSTPEDVAVTIGKGLGFSKLARVELLLEMFDRQIIQDPKRLLNLLEFGDDKEIYEEQNIDRNNAQMENIQMSQGQPVPEPSIVEDHTVHLEVHRRFIKSEEFRMIPEEAKQLLIQHYISTNQIVQQQMETFAKSQQQG